MSVLKKIFLCHFGGIIALWWSLVNQGKVWFNKIVNVRIKLFGLKPIIPSKFIFSFFPHLVSIWSAGQLKFIIPWTGKFKRTIYYKSRIRMSSYAYKLIPLILLSKFSIASFLLNILMKGSCEICTYVIDRRDRLSVRRAVRRTHCTCDDWESRNDVRIRKGLGWPKVNTREEGGVQRKMWTYAKLMSFIIFSWNHHNSVLL